MNKDLKYIIAIVIIVLLGVVREGCNSSKVDKLIDSVQNYSDSAKHYQAENGVLIAYNQSLVLENEEQIKSLFAKNDTLSQLLKKYKRLQSVTTITQEIHITDSFPFEVKIPCDFKPFEIKKESEFYNFHGTISSSDFKLDNLTIFNQQSIVIGERKLGFFRGRERRVEVVNSNPLMQTTNIGNYVISGKKKWYETRGFAFVSGFIVGASGIVYLQR